MPLFSGLTVIRTVIGSMSFDKVPPCVQFFGFVSASIPRARGLRLILRLRFDFDSPACVLFRGSENSGYKVPRVCIVNIY